MASSPLGRRIQVLGNSGAGKSTLARELADLLGVPFVELDALYWRPGWRAPETAAFRAALREATSGDGWVVGGSYLRHTQDVFWDRLDTAIFLDLPLPRIVARVLVRSWRRWRSDELLWGTNRESFWAQLRLWDPKASLVAFAVRSHEPKRREFARFMEDPRWRHVRFVRLRSQADVQELKTELARSMQASLR